MLKNEFTDMCKLDEIVSGESNGVYVITSNVSSNIRVHDLAKYCEGLSKESSQLLDNELKMFYR